MKLCSICKTQMNEDCYLENLSQTLNDYVVVEKDEHLKKIKHPLKVALCPQCGHIELYVDQSSI